MKLYDNKFKRTLMRFLEVFVLGGLVALVNTTEFGEGVVLVFGTALGATLLKFIRELLNERQSAR